MVDDLHTYLRKLDEVVGVDGAAKTVNLENGRVVEYDYLVLATGSVYNYFAHPEWQELAPGLKSIHEARLIRQRLLMAFEQAEQEPDPAKRRALLTSVVIGGGPTGVEMSGAISELGRYMVARDFRNLSVTDMRVILVEAGDRLLAAFPEDLATYAQCHLESIGIEIRLDQRVTDVRLDGVSIGDEAIRCGCVVWASSRLRPRRGSGLARGMEKSRSTNSSGWRDRPTSSP